uniref:Kinesin-like KIF1-type domain-containing protein n=1 Tax=Globisporangium ultimum (strain ATCC 200006 / CBS 805.95 / DAOM BR144) TaxID=431595 RepID=K3WYR1_GLOUD
MQQEQKLAEEKLLKQREEWEIQVREMNEKMREKEDEIKNQMQTEGDLDKRRLAEQLAQQESKLAEELAKAEILFEKKQRELMEKQHALESSLQKQMREAKQLSQQKDRERIERIRFDDVLLQTIPLINEANSISEELQRQTLFVLKLVTCWPDVSLLSMPNLTLEDDECAIAESISANLKVQVKFQESGTFRSVMLDTEQFHANIYIMREMYQVFIENNRTLSAVAAWKDYQESDCDPFYEPPQPQLIGKSYIFLSSIEFGCKISEIVPIFDHRGLTNGTLKCEITPTVLSHEWQALQHKLVESCPEDYSKVQLPTLADFIDSNLRVNIYVDRLRGIPGKLCKDAYVVVKWRDSANKEDEEHASPPTAAPTVDPHIDFSITLDRMITPELITYVRNFPVELSVYGIVPSSNLNSVASQVIDFTKSSSSESVIDDVDDSDGSVVFFDVDASGKNKFASKKKAARQRRNGELLSDDEDAATLLETCQEQLAVQGRILAENTQELENKTNEVVRLQQRLDGEKMEKEILRDALESLARTNNLSPTEGKRQSPLI